MLMLKKDRRNVVREVCLYGLVICAFLINVDIAFGIDVAICTIAYPWPQATADREVPIMTDIIQESADVQLFGADDLDALADWVEAHTCGINHLLILTGVLPSTIYAPGNVEADDSLIEKFLDAGNTIINTGEYAFYTCEHHVLEGANKVNLDAALPNILDAPDAYVWGGRGGWIANMVTMTPTADGKKYLPSVVEYDTNYMLHVEDYDGTPWELEIAIAENTEENLRVDGMIMNTETGGGFGVFVQAFVRDYPEPDISWGAVIGEFVVNYYISELVFVQADGKLTTTWGSIKGE